MTKLIVLVVTLAVSAGAALAGDLETRAAESRAVVKAFADSLKGELVAALKAGGPVIAIDVCGRSAAAITKDSSDRTGWRVARTSLKTRNSNNAPDAWESAVLKSFDARRAAGEDPKSMEFFEAVSDDGKRVFRYMKAIPTAAKPCLSCHGTKIAPAVETALDARYPEDRARGYEAGDIRGAFTITQPMD